MPADMPRDHAPAARWSSASRISDKLGLTRSERERWIGTQAAAAAALLIAAILLMAMALWTDWDVRLADSAFDASAKTFPLRHAWLTETFNHVILKRVLSGLALVVIVAVLWDAASRQRWSWLLRFQLRVIALSAVMVPTAISLIKQISDSHCPWDLQRYGGAEPYVRLFEHLPAGIAPGHCMPGGHASSALWMVSFAIMYVPYRLTRAALSLAILLMLGIGVGWLQQLRGAHFLSHTLWSAWIAVLIVLLITACLDRWPVPAATPSS